MSTLFIYAILLIGHLNVYFYFKHTIKSYSNISGNNNIQKPQIVLEERVTSLNLTKNILNNKQMLLNKNLRQLEFIFEFEMYLEEKTLKNLSLEFLQEFEKIKTEAQLSTLKTTSQLNNRLKMVA